jgi:ribosome-binding protein aMBF1 (putative translation factor)
MKNAKLKKQITNVIGFHYGRELWHSRPEQPYEESTKPLIDDLVRIATCHRSRKAFDLYRYDESDCMVSTIPGEEIGGRIRKLRIKKGWSLAQFARKTDLNIEYLRNIERGESILRLWALEKITEALRVKSSAVLPF